jgi:predicted nucleic acid-binding protein
MNKEIYVLDACAVIAWLKGNEKEAGANVVDDIIVKAIEGNAKVVINIVNLLEVYYGVYRHCLKDGKNEKDSKELADSILSAFQKSSVNINVFSSYDVFIEAGRFKAVYGKMSLADSILLAQALILNATLVTADHHELDRIDNSDEPIKFLWIR